MNIEAMARRMSLLTRALPMRVLIVDDDELEQELLTDHLIAAGFEVVCAQDGKQALEMIERQWFPLIITDWHMPVMDGIAFTEALRASGNEDSYVIMLTIREASLDYERGYLAGVDDYLTKRIPDAELFTRIHAGFNTIAMRRSLKETQVALAAASPIDSGTGAFTAQETHSRLESELRRAQRYGRMLSVLLIGVRAIDSPAPPSAEALKQVVTTLQQAIRTQVDWVGHTDSATGDCVFALVLVEAAPGDGPNIKERLRNVLAAIDCGMALEFDFGLVGLERGGREGNMVDTSELLQVADHCRLCAGHEGPAQLSAVQRSVAVGATISCRHGYAVESSCTFKSLGATQRTLSPQGRMSAGAAASERMTAGPGERRTADKGGGRRTADRSDA